MRRMICRLGTVNAIEHGMERVTFTLPSDTGVFFRALASFAVAVLVGLGIGGTAYKLAAPDGWLARLFGHSLPGSVCAMLAFLVIGICPRLMLAWMALSGRDRYSELPVYLCAGAGGVYALQAAMTL